jgi:hypothetical protein
MANDLSKVPAGISVLGAGTHIELRHNRIHAIANPTGTCGGNPADCNAHGLAVYGTNASSSLSNIVIDGNELFNLILGQSESLPLNGNVAGWTVANNIIHDNNNIGIDAIGFESTASSTSTDQARNGLISGNLVYNCSDNNNPAYCNGVTCNAGVCSNNPGKSCRACNDCYQDNSAGGIYVDGGTNIVIERNISHNNNLGIELASEHSGHTTSNVTARSNLIYFNSGPGISIGGFDSSVGSTSACMIVNNTLLNNDSTPNDGSGEFQMHFSRTVARF